MPGRRACFEFVVTNSFGCTVFHVTKKIYVMYSIVENTSCQLINMYLSYLSNIYVTYCSIKKSKKIFEFL